MESAFEYREGVVEVISGYIGGDTVDPGYEELLDIFWRSIDPIDGGGQFSEGVVSSAVLWSGIPVSSGGSFTGVMFNVTLLLGPDKNSPSHA